MSSWGLYKPGQGYWVRVMTAAAIALITFATAGWLMAQMSVLSTKLPVRSWTTQLAMPATAKVQQGDRVTLLRPGATSGAQPEVLGAATLVTFDPATNVAKIGSFEAAIPGAHAEDAALVRSADGAAFTADVKNGLRGEPPISTTILQGMAAALALVLGAVTAWYFCGVKRGSVEFLIATDMEMKKVAWSTRKDILTSTWVVVGAAVLIAAVLFGIDVGFQAIFRGIGVLQ